MTTVSNPGAEAALSHQGIKDVQSRSAATSPSLSTASRPSFARSPASNPNFTNLPPLITTQPRPRTNSRVPSFVGKRLSTFSNVSARLPQSRPESNVFPNFHSSLSYALVRDFAYDVTNALHYGPSQEPLSATSTTASEFGRRLSDPQVVSAQGTRIPWSGHPSNAEANFYGGPQLPAMAYGDGPPWMEDEDLLSPIVTSSRHRKTQSDADYFGPRDRDSGTGVRRTSHSGQDEDQELDQDHDQEGMDGDPDDDSEAYPGSPAEYPQSRKGSVIHVGHAHSESTPNHSHSSSLQVIGNDDDESRYSRDYSFSIASPDEEMHGKAIALFDFESENNNELPLVEGQVLWISYRHGQGWLVAKDPNTGEDGLVPEAYVRMEREIQGGFGGLNGQQVTTDDGSPVGPETPRLSSPFIQGRPEGGSPGAGAPAQYPVVSHFTTSSRDLLPQHARSPGLVSTPRIQHLGSQLAEVTTLDDGTQESPDTPQGRVSTATG